MHLRIRHIKLELKKWNINKAYIEKYLRNLYKE